MTVVDSPRQRLEPTSSPQGTEMVPSRTTLALVRFVLALGLGVVVGLSFISDTHSQLVARGGYAMFLGNLFAMTGTYLALVMVLVVSRLAFVERVLGQDRLVHLHKTLSPWPLSLIVLHVVLTTVGYAQNAKTGFMHEFGTFLSSFPNMITATIGFGVMVTVGIVSIRAIRVRLRRETWWTIHLTMYLALALSYAHILALGPAFVGHPLARVFWIVIWLGTAGVVLIYRVAVPLVRSSRHSLQVAEVKREAAGVASIVLQGRNLDKLKISGGQFFSWRFLAPGIWWQAHPYSISALPKPPFLRLTVKGIGDHSKFLASLKPGTKVLIEGPFGAMTVQNKRPGKTVLIAGGIGITALRSLLEDLDSSSEPVLIRRVTKDSELILKGEIDSLIKNRKGVLHELVGSRQKVRFDASKLKSLVPDIIERDVFVCGSPGFVDSVVQIVCDCGVPPEKVHFEAFSL